VRCYLRYSLSYHDVEELPAERGIVVDHVTSTGGYRRSPRSSSTPDPTRHTTGDRWFVEETYVKVTGRRTYLYRAVDQHGQLIDVLLSERRDGPPARASFTRALSSARCRSRSLRPDAALTRA
jgi:transposase-like protein